MLCNVPAKYIFSNGQTYFFIQTFLHIKIHETHEMATFPDPYNITVENDKNLQPLNVLLIKYTKHRSTVAYVAR